MTLPNVASAITKLLLKIILLHELIFCYPHCCIHDQAIEDYVHLTHHPPHSGLIFGRTLYGDRYHSTLAWSTVMILFGQISLGKLCRPRSDWSGSTLFAILSASFLTHYSMVEPHSSNFWVITTNFLAVRIFRKFTVPKAREQWAINLPCRAGPCLGVPLTPYPGTSLSIFIPYFHIKNTVTKTVLSTIWSWSQTL